MKSKKPHSKADYAQINRKLYIYILSAAATAVLLVVFVHRFIRRQGVFGNWVVRFLQNRFYLSDVDAMRIYNYTVRGNIEIIVWIAIALCFLVLCRVMLTLFMRYFGEINAGLDTLIAGDETPIAFSPELAFMEHKLSALKETLLKREQDAKLAEQRKTDLVMYLAHDLKTPLTSVVGYLSLIDEAPDMPREQRAKYVHITLDKALRLEQLIDEFFEITRYNIATIELDKKPIDLHYMLLQMTDEFYPQLAASAKRATVHAPEDLVIEADPDKLARVFNNILKNAVAYSETGSVIDIEASQSGDTATVVFTNAGSIAKDKLDTLFDKFYRLDSARSTHTGGAGLGLAIAKEIVTLHGGSIEAESGGGRTAFTVKLPVGNHHP